jgi:predicted  nucleic acid-binding Zn-ribbon protein
MTKKYQELSIETEKLRQDNSALKLENADLNRQISALNTELDTMRTELTEANEFLQQGYRDEMRRAQVAELEALKKILKILGAELTEPIQQAKLAKEG